MTTSPFHYAFKVKDLESTRKFYGEILGCEEGRSTNTWVDFDFFGNQISAHLGQPASLDYCGQVDGRAVPIPHFGCWLIDEKFEEVQNRFEAAQIEFIIKPHVRYADQDAPQRTMFVLDFSGNPLEFKATHPKTND